MDEETKQFLTEELKSDLEDISRALRWSEIHSAQLGLVELNAELIQMREKLKPMLEQFKGAK
jgi:hypothetical protein